MTPTRIEKISTISLILLISGAIDSIRNLPATALFGSTLIFFFVFSAILFLIPVALVSAELASTWSHDEGGIYSWVKHAFGDKVALIAIWLQWINTLIWFPTMLSFIAGISGYLISPELINNKYYLISVILSVFWGLTIVAMSGIRTSSRFASICASIGMIIPMLVIIALGGVWMLLGKPSAIIFDKAHLLPSWQDSQSWVSLTAIMTSFLGMELAAVHVKNLYHPQKDYPKAMFFSVILILTTMILGSLSIAIVLPLHNINLVNGVMDAFHAFLSVYHLSALMPVMIFLLLIGSIGGMTNWVIAPAKGLMLAAESGLLPHKLCALNRHNMPVRILLLQAVIVTLLCGGFLLLPSINAIYWFFTDLSTELYMFMYLLMFVAAFALKNRHPNRTGAFAIPFGKVGYFITCILGLLGSLLTIVIGFIPPEGTINVGSGQKFQMLFTIGLIGMMLPAFILCLRKGSKK